MFHGVVVMEKVATCNLRKDYVKNKKDYYQHIMSMISSKLQSWKGKLLSYGGIDTLIKHTLQSIPIHGLSGMNPPLNVLNIIQRMLTQFFGLVV